MIGQASPKFLRNLLERVGIAPAGGQEHTRVEQACAGRLELRGADPIDGRPQVSGPDGLGQEIVHAGREAPLAVLLSRPRRPNDGQ